MNTIIWKFELPNLSNEVFMPVDAEILSTKIQNATVCIWALVNPTAIKAARYFEVVPTGVAYYNGYGKFIGTCMSVDHSLVLHVFESK